METRPPIRAPHYVWDDDGPPTMSSAQEVLSSLCAFARYSPTWLDRAGREIAVCVVHDTKQSARIEFTGAIDGRVELSISSSLWVRADVHLKGA